jgi:hypothetical protein
LLSQAFAGEVDPVGVVDHPVEDRIGECRWGAARLSETSGCGRIDRNRRYRDGNR